MQQTRDVPSPLRFEDALLYGKAAKKQSKRVSDCNSNSNQGAPPEEARGNICLITSKTAREAVNTMQTSLAWATKVSHTASL